MVFHASTSNHFTTQPPKLFNILVAINLTLMSEQECNQGPPRWEAVNTSGGFGIVNEQSLNKATVSLGTRWANSLIDGIFIMIFIGIGVVLVAALTKVMLPEGESISPVGKMILSGLMAVFPGLYYFCMEYGTGGSTIGKYFTKSKVVNEQGNEPSFFACLLRTFGRGIPFDWLVALVGDRRCIHDLISKTYVIKDDSWIIKNRESASVN